jgi:hypothetical protein
MSHPEVLFFGSTFDDSLGGFGSVPFDYAQDTDNERFG